MSGFLLAGKIRKLDLKIDLLLPGGRIALELQTGGSQRCRLISEVHTQLLVQLKHRRELPLHLQYTNEPS